MTGDFTHDYMDPNAFTIEQIRAQHQRTVKKIEKERREFVKKRLKHLVTRN